MNPDGTCFCCGGEGHTASSCPHYSARDREMMLIGGTLFVNVMLENMSFGQNLLHDFEQALELPQNGEEGTS